MPSFIRPRPTRRKRRWLVPSKAAAPGSMVGISTLTFDQAGTLTPPSTKSWLATLRPAKVIGGGVS